MVKSLPVYFLTALPFLLTSCSAGTATEQQPAGGGRGNASGGAVPVEIGVVADKSVPLQITAIGAGEPYSTVSVHAQLTGELKSVHFKEGEDVREGQLLFSLDRRPLEAALQQVQANLAKDVAQAANARSQADRFEDLANRGITPRDQLDQARAAATALEATVEADKAAVENATVQLQYATVSAPLSGRTGALMVHEGSLVRANDTTPLVVINQVSPIYVSFAIPESRFAELKHYMAQGSIIVEARSPGEETTAKGTISFVDNQVDAATGTIRVKAVFQNARHTLWPGQFADVTLTLTTDPHAVVVPTAAVQTGQQGSYVFVVRQDQTVDLRPVTIARAVGDETVIQSGLTPGETVVTDGQLRVVAGSRVSVKRNSQVTQ
jgi:membrane fusion protein, multidrug efflux system